jgi:AraC-like DNA-binding protein
MREAGKSHRLPARYIAQLADFLESLGVERASILRAARIRSLDGAKAQITLRQLEALLQAAEHASGHVDLGFELGRRLNPTSHDILGFALLTSPTFGHVLRLLVNYQRLIQPFFALSLQRRAGRVDLVYLPTVTLSHRSLRLFQEAIVVSNHFAFRSMLHGRFPPYDVWLSIERPPHAERYRQLSPARVHFDTTVPGVRISLDAVLQDTPLAMANFRAMQAAEERCKVLLRQTQARRRWREWCRMMLHESEESRPTLDQLAGLVNISPRTLARYLEAENTNFRDLALEVRTERARRLLADGALSVTQIGYRLGYSDVTSFVRSFRAQTGRTPGSLRA